MKARLIDAPDLTPAVDAGADVVYRQVEISLKTRVILRLMQMVMKPLLSRMIRYDYTRIARTQLQVAGMKCPDTAGLPLDYQVVGRVPGHVVGTLARPGDDGRRPVVLWIHGGAFLLPAAPAMHLVMVSRLCRQLDADGFIPDYRLAPFNRFPAGLDDCEFAYAALLERGYSPAQIVIGGDSAGGNLALGLLQRIRKRGWGMPSCAVLVSPVTEMGRVHSPPSRHRLLQQDPLLPVAALQRVDELYAGDWDAADPELSPLYMECHDLPPLFFLASDNEVLMDETIMLARRCREAGVQTTCHVWPILPHAFPLFEHYFPEVRQAREEIAAFARAHLRADIQK